VAAHLAVSREGLSSMKLVNRKIVTFIHKNICNKTQETFIRAIRILVQ
jgi:hypothetical protein